MAPTDPRERYDDLLERESHELLTPVRPHSVENLTFENEATGETGGWIAVLYAARAETTAVKADLGHDEHEAEEIADARWFPELPDDVFNSHLTREVYRRCVDGEGPC